jgi:quercetin dioxygenase-like cupin family protein
MAGQSRAVITRVEDCPVESWDDPARGRLSWFTLLSSDRTPTDSMSAGIAVLPPGGGSLEPHRHAQPEIYLILEGSGLLQIDGEKTKVSAGATIFIPGNAAHCLHNDADQTLRLFYVFPTGSFTDVVYRFEDRTPA